MNAALQQLKVEEADIVISDLRMNDRYGLEFMKEAAKISPSARRILMSGYEDKSIVLLALSNGLINHFVYKPWEDSEFTQLISKCVESKARSSLWDHKGILHEFGDVPSPPRFQERLNQMLGSMNAPLSKIVEEIEINPALVAKLLRIANSVHLGIRKRVTSIRDAVLFIGLEYVASVVTALEAFHSYSSRVAERYAGLVEEMSIAAVRRAMIAKEIALRSQEIENKYAAYVSSLLQDIGLFARICLKPEMYDVFLKTIDLLNMTAGEAESKVFADVTHERVGAAILDNWNFPSEIVDTVRAHHSQTAETAYVRIIQLAMLLDGTTEGYSYDESLVEIVPEWRHKLGLRENNAIMNTGE